MYNIVELFSGIGSQVKALKNIGLEINVLGTCEWDIHASVAYDAIHNSPELPFEILKLSKEDILKELQNFTLSNNGKEKMDFKTLKTYSVGSLRRIYASILRNKNFVDVSSLTGESMPKRIDILTYSFPCQDLSNVGAFHGYNKGIDKDSGSRFQSVVAGRKNTSGNERCSQKTSPIFTYGKCPFITFKKTF